MWLGGVISYQLIMALKKMKCLHHCILIDAHPISYLIELGTKLTSVTIVDHTNEIIEESVKELLH